jgi:hypothetical protein
MQTFIQLIKNNSIHFQLAYEPDGEDLDTKIPWVRALREHSIPVRCNVFIAVILLHDDDAGR